MGFGNPDNGGSRNHKFHLSPSRSQRNTWREAPAGSSLPGVTRIGKEAGVCLEGKTEGFVGKNTGIYSDKYEDL